MIVLQAKDLAKSYGTKLIFEDLSFTLSQGEKVGLVGPNGAGKTTLFRCLIGEEETDFGEIMLSNKLNLGYLQQLPLFLENTTLFDAVMDVFSDILELRAKLRELELTMGQVQGNELQNVMEQYGVITEEYERAGGFHCESTARKILSGVGFAEHEHNRWINSFSGGEKTRASLARLLAKDFDILLLDEPTNHLDLQSVEWLEGFLKDYIGTVLMISHDRYFLDKITDKTFELEHNRLDAYPGNYTKYLQLKAEHILAQTRAYEKQQKEIQETEAYINKYRAGIKSKQARGRQSILNRLERIEAPEREERLRLQQGSIAESGQVVLDVKEVTFKFDDKLILDKVDLLINKAEKVALIGANGTGKSTLLKLVLNKFQPLIGDIRIGSRVKIGYYDQEHADLNRSNTILQEIMYEYGFSEAEARNHLAVFLFREDDVYKKIADLSGGERGRLSFLKIFLSNPNFLILDEPTNHLDIRSKEIIEDFLVDFTGTILMVSHDRYFLDKTADRVVELEKAKLTSFPGNYSYYKEKKASLLAQQVTKKAEEKSLNKEKQTVSKPKINKAKTRDQISNLEKEIEKLEERLGEISQLLADSDTYQNEELAKELTQEYKSLEEIIPQKYEEWEKLNELLS